MTGSNAPDAATHIVDSRDTHDNALAIPNGHPPPSTNDKRQSQASPVPSIEGDDAELPDAPAPGENAERPSTNGGDEDAASEAETLIESPVKRKEAEKQNPVIKAEKPQKSRIGSLPVPGDDDEDDSAASAMESREMSVGKATSNGDPKVEDVEMMMEEGSDKENASDSLSSVHSSGSNPPSRASSRSRALSERPQQTGNGTSGSPNPRKRKHRASSVSLPSSKRQSMDPPKRTRLRGMHSEDNVRTERSPSPKSRAHRRTVSTQSALDGTVESGSRKRRSLATYPGREPKSSKNGWEESDASSETTARGQDENKRPLRGVGRSTSTPGRHVGREHKRHVNKYGFTRLAEACEEGNLDSVKDWREKDPDQLELAEFAGNRPLQIAALNGNAEVVSYLIDQGCQIDCANGDKDTPLIDAAENGHLEVVRLLLDAGVDPLRQNLKGQQALDVVTDETDEASGIRAALHKAIDHWNSNEAKQQREEEEEQRHRAGPSKELHFMARTYENLLKLVQNNDRNGVREFLAARVPVDNAIIAAAAKTGDLYLLNMLLAEMTEKKANQKPEKPMTSVLGTSHFEMVKALTELDSFNPLWRSRSGKTWPELAEERNGPMWRQERELLQRLYDAHTGGKERRSSSPVTKRDGGKRRYQHPDADDESEEDGDRLPKRKSARRLMSRKDMRATSKVGLSDSSEDEQDDSADEQAAPDVNDATEEATVEMKPPETPSTRRRLRSKSTSSQPPEVSPKSLRKRSNSFRNPVEKLLPTVHEKNEDRDSGSEGIVVAENERLRREREEEAKFAVAQAKRLEERRKAEEAAAVEAKRVEEEARRAEEERRAEDERKAAEEREAAEIRRREEQARMIEQARIAEEERLQRERERNEAIEEYRSEVLDALPSALRCVLDPEFAFKLEGEAGTNYILRHFLPLRSVPGRTSPADAQVFNLQAAALIREKGLELFFQPGKVGFEGSLADLWATEQLEDDDLQFVDQILARMPYQDVPALDDDDEMQGSEVSFQDELRKTAERYNAFISTRKRLRGSDCKAALRRVRLEDVLRNIHPSFQDIVVNIDSAMPQITNRDEISKQLGTQDYVQSMQKLLERGDRPLTTFENGQFQDLTDATCTSLTHIVVLHEK